MLGTASAAVAAPRTRHTHTTHTPLQEYPVKGEENVPPPAVKVGRRASFTDHDKRGSLMQTSISEVQDQKWVAAGEYAGKTHTPTYL